MKTTFFALFLFCSFNLLAQVGIGTTAPTADLDIDGTVRVRSLSSGTLTSDADGNLWIAHWAGANCTHKKQGVQGNQDVICYSL